MYQGMKWMLAVAALAGTLSAQDDVTTVQITGKPLVKEISRFGVNIGDDSYWSPALFKVRKTLNFEGTTYRQCHAGSYQDAYGASTFYPVSEKYGWSNLYTGADFTIISGPAKGTRGKIKGISQKAVPHQWIKGALSTNWYFEFAEPVKMPDGQPVWSNAGVLVEALLVDRGAVPYDRGYWWAASNQFVTGDVPPGSFGTTAAQIGPSGYIRLPTVFQRYTDTRGQWLIRFWAKAKEGSAACRVTASVGKSQDVKLSDDWKKYEVTFQSLNIPEPTTDKDDPHLAFLLEIKNGVALMDDVEVLMADDTNPTPFAKDIVKVLEDLKPGCVRFLQMGGRTMESSLRPPLQRTAGNNNPWASVLPGSGQSPVAASLGELCALAEHLDCEVWYSVPGTLRVEEIDLLMEYLGAPADQGAGKWRAEQGHPKPWTETLKRIHIEFGNEAWNMMGVFQAGGYNGPDYWNDLIARGKQSAWYKDNIKFVAAGQNAEASMSAKILKQTPLADRYAVAPYLVHDLKPEDMPSLATPEKMFGWLYSKGIAYMTVGMAKQKEVIQKTGVEFSVYEINHHITGGKGPLEPRNQMVASEGGALNVLNGMLILLKDYGMRCQNFFTLAQKEYSAPGVGNVRLWGGVLSAREDSVRYRPTWLALTLANGVMAGDLVETVHTGAKPLQNAEGVIAAGSGTYPVIWSYAFSNGSKRGLILFNLDVSNARNVKVEFDGAAVGKKASVQWLASDSILANNEYEAGAPQVALSQETLTEFSSGQELKLPPHSMCSVSWEVK